MHATPESNVYLCADCEFSMQLTAGSEPIESFEGVSGKPIYRVVTLDGVEVHRCGSVFLTMSPTIEPTIDADVATDSW
jgi:hypothetical protein